jgi:iron complex transport system substrate-binding protein
MFKRSIALGAAVVILYGCIFGSPGEMPGKQTKEMRIISLAPSLTEALYLLGSGDRLKGCTTYCLKPEAAQKKEKIGTLIDFNVEKIFALKPDLVLGMEFSDRRAIEKLKDLGIRIELFPSPKNFAHLCESFLRLGKILGAEEKAREIVDAARQEVAFIREQTAKAEKIKIFWQLGAKPLFAATKGYFTNDYIEFAGGINIAADAPSGIYSREEVLKRNPDVIIIITMGIASEEEKKNWQNYSTINAVKNDRIYIIDSYTYCSPTPRSFVKALKELLTLLRPGPAARGAY